jgi:limonene-1,2-epoxide hydrolase
MLVRLRKKVQKLPRRLTPAETARAFIEAFNGRDLDGFAATLHPEVEIHASRGLRTGIDQAREWATRAPGGLQQRIEVEDVREDGDRALALIVREWWWEEPDTDQAGADEMAWLFEFRDGLIASWRPFDDRDDALAAFTAV